MRQIPRGSERAGDPLADEYGPKGYMMRNGLMAERATHLVAFWTGQSPGTRAMIQFARSLIGDDNIRIVPIGDAHRKGRALSVTDVEPDTPPVIPDDAHSTKTRVGHASHDPITTYAGRRRIDGELQHFNNTDLHDPGWLGNPYVTEDAGGTYTREESIAQFRDDFEAALETDPDLRAAVADLAGDTLGCYCQHLDENSPACHAEVITEQADQLAAE